MRTIQVPDGYTALVFRAGNDARERVQTINLDLLHTITDDGEDG